MSDRAAVLHRQLTLVMAKAERGELDGVEIEDGVLYIARMKPAVTRGRARAGDPA